MRERRAAGAHSVQKSGHDRRFPRIISSHSAIWRPIGQRPSHVRLVKIDSPMVREYSGRSSSATIAQALSWCVDSPSLQTRGVRHMAGRARMACEK
jgi:hypothetical protein